MKHCWPVSELLGYARVSTADQTLDLQSDALSVAGCSRIWSETASGATTARPQLDDLLSHLRPGTPWWCGGWIDSAVPCHISSDGRGP